MPDAGASRKRQITDQRIPSDLTIEAEPPLGFFCPPNWLD
jgi:hypothetical protein